MIGVYTRRIGLIGMLVGTMASLGVSGARGEVTEIFIPGGAFVDMNGKAFGVDAGGFLGGQGFFSGGMGIPSTNGVVEVGSTFLIPESWFNKEIDIILVACQKAFVGDQFRITFSIGNLPGQEKTAILGPEDGGGSQVKLLTTTVGSGVLANQQLQGIVVGRNGGHADDHGLLMVVLGVIVRLT